MLGGVVHGIFISHCWGDGSVAMLSLFEALVERASGDLAWVDKLLLALEDQFVARMKEGVHAAK
eukprot:275874-Rhodomonas_salina.1